MTTQYTINGGSTREADLREGATLKDLRDFIQLTTGDSLADYSAVAGSSGLAINDDTQIDSFNRIDFMTVGKNAKIFL